MERAQQYNYEDAMKTFRVEGWFARLKQKLRELHGLGPSRRTARHGRSTGRTSCIGRWMDSPMYAESSAVHNTGQDRMVAGMPQNGPTETPFLRQLEEMSYIRSQHEKEENQRRRNQDDVRLDPDWLHPQPGADAEKLGSGQGGNDIR